MINIAKLINYFQAWVNCRKNNNTLWQTKWRQAINELLKELPHGNGINAEAGIQFDWENSTPDNLRFNFSYQHMSGNGYYTGWTEHELIIQPSFIGGFTLQVTLVGEEEDEDGIIEYLEEMLYSSFYYESDYHKQTGFLARLWQQLKKKLEPVIASCLSCKKQSAKS